jgi:predicted amidohydrolase YtcJ
MVDDRGNLVPGKFLGYMREADRAGLQLTVHAIGDEANSLLLDYLEALERANGRRDRRFRLVHAQVVSPKDFQRFKALRVVAEVQPFHLSDDMRWMEERIGKERCRGAYAFRSLQKSGAVLSFGTDWPGTSAAEYPINPMLGLYAAVTRQTVTGQPAGGWFPEERIGIQEAPRLHRGDGLRQLRGGDQGLDRARQGRRSRRALEEPPGDRAGRDPDNGGLHDGRRWADRVPAVIDGGRGSKGAQSPGHDTRLTCSLQ